MKIVSSILLKSMDCSKERSESMDKLFDNSWENISEVIIYGLGMIGKKYLDMLKEQFTIKFIVDNNPNVPDCYQGVKTISLNEMQRMRVDEKIIVLASKKAFLSIKNDLDKIGLIEYQDYVSFDDFVKEWYWQIQGKNCIREVHMSVNTNCTYNCEKCNMFMPYYKEIKIYTLDEVKQSLDVFFPLVDYVFVFSFLGGEPFLNCQLKNILEYTYTKYRSKIGRIEVVSNGSMIPDAETLDVMSKYKVLVRISDYTAHINYGRTLEQMIGVLKNYEIPYSIEKSLEWVDFCFPSTDKGKKLPIKDVRAHMLCCSPAFHGLNDGKFYYCHVAWSAEKAGLINLKDSDFIELKKYSATVKNKRYLIEYASGKMEDNYVSLCEKCMGCGTDNPYVVPAGKQRSRNILI